MEEFDLKNIWKNAEQQAEEHYQSIEPKVLEMAQKKSNSLLNKMKRNIITESIIALLIWAAIFYWMRAHPHIWVLAVILVALGIYSIIYTRRLVQKIKSIPTRNILESIAAQHELLSKSLKKIKVLILVLVPIGYLLGFFFSITDEVGDISPLANWKKLMLVIGISWVVLYTILWFIFKKYIYWLYQKPLDEMKTIHQNLLEQHGEGNGNR